MFLMLLQSSVSQAFCALTLHTLITELFAYSYPILPLEEGKKWACFSHILGSCTSYLTSLGAGYRIALT